MIVEYIFELGYILQHVATMFQILKILRKQNIEMISLETNILFLIGSLSRIGWMWESLLQSCYIAYFELIMGISSLGYLIFLYEVNKSNNYYSQVLELPHYLKLYCLIPCIAVLSIIFSPDTEWFTSQVFVPFSMYSEAFGLLPQLYMMHKSKDVGNISELYIVFLGFARLFRLLFWVYMYMDGLNFFSLIVADLIHFALLFNFIYKAIKNFSGISLPTFSDDKLKMF